MMHPKIMLEIERSRWLMTPEALRDMVAIVERENSVDYSTFHAIEKSRRDALVADLGEGVEGTKYSYVRGNVGLMYLDGPIIPRGDMFTDISGITSIESLTEEFHALQESSQVEQIVLLFDSPGGNVVGISEFASMVRASKKPVTGFVYGMAASAAYWIASATHRLIASDTGEVGSIGVVATYVDRSKADEKNGVRRIEIVSSQSPNKRPDMSTDEGRASVQSVLNDLAGVFIDTVARNRNVTSDDVMENFGKGGMLVGRRALDAGMVDALGTLDGLLSELEASGTRSQSVYFEQQPTTEGAMPDGKENAKLTASELRESHAESVAEIAQEAVAAERARIQSIEALGDKFTESSPAVRAEVRKVIDASKFDADATASSVGMLLLDAVAKVQPSAATAPVSVGAGARELAGTASQIPDSASSETQESENAEDEQKLSAGIASCWSKK